MKNFPFPMPVIVQSGPSEPDVSHRDLPTRVSLAIDVYNTLCNRQKPQAFVNENQIEVIDAPELTQEEIETRDSALFVITQYLNGSLQRNAYEELDYQEKIKQKKGINSYNDEIPGRLIFCPVCSVKPIVHCQICNGVGQILVQPVGISKEQNSFLENILNIPLSDNEDEDSDDGGALDASSTT